MQVKGQNRKSCKEQRTKDNTATCKEQGTKDNISTPEAGHILGPRAQGLRGEADCSEGEAGVAGVVEAVHGEGVRPGQSQPGHRGRGVAGAELQHIGPPVH